MKLHHLTASIPQNQVYVKSYNQQKPTNNFNLYHKRYGNIEVTLKINLTLGILKLLLRSTLHNVLNHFKVQVSNSTNMTIHGASSQHLKIGVDY